MSELLPCPFCGGEAKPSGERFENTILSWVYCTSCGAAGGYRHTEAEAIAAWNSRAPMSDEDLKILLDEFGVSERTCHIEHPFYGDAPIINGQPRCSECKTDFEVGAFQNYCPNCGARVVSE